MYSTDISVGYYLRLFPNLQQKTASGFLTTLWNKDSSRNNWSLIAKLYSFVRDEVGKPQVSLSEYLNLACPLMQIVHPDVYLQELSWTVESGEDGAKKLVRVPRSTTKEGQTATSTPPNTELGLLVELVRAGYMSDKGFELVESLNSSYSGLMTAQTSERDLETATEETSKPCPVQKSTFNHSFQSFAANSFPSSVSPASHIPHINKFALQASLVDNARRCYPYNSNNSSLSYGELMLRLDAVPESQPYDIDNPWDVDAVLGYQQPEQCSDSTYLHSPSATAAYANQVTTESPESSVYDPREDFHYSF